MISDVLANLCRSRTRPRLITVSALYPQCTGAQGRLQPAYVNECYPAGFEVGLGSRQAFYLIVSPVYKPPRADDSRVVAVLREEYAQ